MVIPEAADSLWKKWENLFNILVFYLWFLSVNGNHRKNQNIHIEESYYVIEVNC